MTRDEAKLRDRIAITEAWLIERIRSVWEHNLSALEALSEVVLGLGSKLWLCSNTWWSVEGTPECQWLYSVLDDQQSIARVIELIRLEVDYITSKL